MQVLSVGEDTHRGIEGLRGGWEIRESRAGPMPSTGACAIVLKKESGLMK
jgi:hypothetical protein